jgi:hypothetical protein
MNMKQVSEVVAAIDAIDLSTPNEGGDIRAARRALAKINLDVFKGAKANFIDSDGKTYPAVIADAIIHWISKTEINDHRPENGLTLMLRGRVQYNTKDSAFRTGVAWPDVTKNRVARQCVFQLKLDEGAPVVAPVCPEKEPDEPVLAGANTGAVLVTGTGRKRG